MNPRAKAPTAALAVVLASGLVGCDRPPVIRNCDPDASVPCPNLNDPAGRIEGTLVYQGPPPPESPTRPGVASGRVIILLFEYDNPPPPEGSATTAVSFQTVSAAQLFQNAVPLPDGNVRATIQFMFPGILHGGEYQIRAFYSRNEQIEYDGRAYPSGFHPLFGVRNLPVKGDVGGGAIVDPTAAIPVFQRIVVGEPAGLRPDGHAAYRIPERGAVTPNVTVFIGATFPTERPMFSVYTGSTPTTVQTPSGEMTIQPPLRLAPSTNPGPPNVGPDGVPLPGYPLLYHAIENGLLPEGTPVLDMTRNVVIQRGDTGEDVPAFTLQAGLPVSECAVAAIAGVRCSDDPFRDIGFYEFALDANQNGVIELTAASMFADAHPTLITTNPLASRTSGRLPWLYPLVIFAKLHDPTEDEARLLVEGQSGTLPREIYERIRAGLNRPEGLDPARGRYPVILFGSVVPSGSAAGLLLRPWDRGHRQAEPYPRVVILPIAVEIHGHDRARDWWAIIPPGDRTLIEKSQAFLPPNYRCFPYEPEYEDGDSQITGIPAGRYAINIIGPGGQAWTTPNELAGFTPASPDHPVCQQRGICQAPSQGMILRIRRTEPPPPGVEIVCPTPAVRSAPPR